jgi:hypothetical protein
MDGGCVTDATKAGEEVAEATGELAVVSESETCSESDMTHDDDGDDDDEHESCGSELGREPSEARDERWLELLQDFRSHGVGGEFCGDLNGPYCRDTFQQVMWQSEAAGKLFFQSMKVAGARSQVDMVAFRAPRED